MALQFLPYALAAYGGYSGYQASKDAGGSGLQRLLGAATGAAAGYYGGKGALSGGSALGIPGFSAAQQSFTPFLQTGPLQSLGASFPSLGIPQIQSATADAMPVQSVLNPAGQRSVAAATTAQQAMGGPAGQRADQNLLQKLFTRQRLTKAGDFTGELEVSPGKAATGIATLAYLSGAFENEPQDVYTPTYNLAVAELQKQRGGFKYIDPETGQEKVFAQPYIPEADPANKTDYQMGPYALAYNRFNTGGLAEVKKFNEGGINYLPSKRSHDEDDANNYVRASGYVEDGSGTGDKDEDTMLAQLADGEFVTRADGVLGAGIIAGANPNSMKDMREKGAQYFYEQQKRYKRVFDLLEGSRNAKAEAKVN
jgi:hypothetical protein